MINFLRIFTILALSQVFRFSGVRRLNLFIYFLGRVYEIILTPIRSKKYQSKDLGSALLIFIQNAGPIYIKLGQSISTRPDIVGEEIASYLKNLQDRLPSFSMKYVREIIELELGQKVEEIFDDFTEKEVAAASIAQVHKAKLKDGTIVAAKILRPNIYEQYERDINFLYFCAKFAKYIISDSKRLKPKEIIDLSKQIMEQELDLEIEASNACELQEKSDHSVVIPKIYWDYTTRKVMVSSWIDGISIYDNKKMAQSNIDIDQVSKNIAVMFFNQAYKDGFFHADLHPGNIMVTKEGKIALVDFGIMGKLPEKDRLAVTEILYGFLRKDYMRIAEIHKEMNYIPEDSDLNLFAQRSRIIGQRIVGMELKDISVAKTLESLFKLTKDFGMEVQPQLLLLQKTTIVIEGIGRMLNPNLNMWKLAEPWIKKWAAKNISPEAKILKLLKTFLDEAYKKINKI